MKRIMRLKINGTEREVAVPPNALLLDVLREELDLTGTKRGCDLGTCGCCTVTVDGEARLSCLTLAAVVEGADVRTIEGIGNPDALHPLQQAFSEAGGSQCGFCTPGFVMSAKALLDRNVDPTDDEIKDALAGNLCRCTGYIKIYDAVRQASRELNRQRETVTPRQPRPKEREVVK